MSVQISLTKKQKFAIEKVIPYIQFINLMLNCWIHNIFNSVLLATIVFTTTYSFILALYGKCNLQYIYISVCVYVCVCVNSYTATLNIVLQDVPFPVPTMMSVVGICNADLEGTIATYLAQNVSSSIMLIRTYYVIKL